MALDRVSYRDIVALPSLDEIKARKAARKAALQASQSSGAPEVTAPTVGAPKLITLIDSDNISAPAPELGAPGLGAATLGAPEVTAPTLTAPELDGAHVYQRPPTAGLRQAITVQDGHTHGEHALFATLWRLARPVAGEGGVRAISIGERSLAAEVPMAYSTIQENLRSLVRKLAIEIRAAQPNKPKTYVAFSFEEILRRRRAAGLTHVLRRTSGVFLVTPGAPKVGAPNLNVGALSSDAPDLKMGAPSFGSSGAPRFGALYKEQELYSRTSSSEEPRPAVICNAIINVMGMVDDDAIALLIRRCRERALDATNEEIAEIAAVQAKRIVRMRNVDNPVGLLIDQAPKCFEGELFARYRREKAAEAKRLEELYNET